LMLLLLFSSGNRSREDAYQLYLFIGFFYLRCRW